MKNAPIKDINRNYPSLRTSLHLSLVQEDPRPKYSTLPQINGSRNCYENLYPLFEEILYIKEEFHILILNASGRLIGHSRISEGGTGSCLADPKTIFSTALIVPGARSIVLAHNHPGQDCTPSSADNRLTKRLVECGNLLELNVIDHIILTDGNYYSYSDQGLL